MKYVWTSSIAEDMLEGMSEGEITKLKADLDNAVMAIYLEAWGIIKK